MLKIKMLAVRKVARCRNEKKAEKEKCCLCREETGYLVSTPISERAYYVEGVGQLCAECWKKSYGKKGKEVIDSKDIFLNGD